MDGPARWGAVAVLGGASLTGIVWSIARGTAAPQARVVTAGPDGAGPAQAGAPAQVDTPRPQSERTGTPARGAKVNLNTASAAELETLPGIGPELARRIVEHRASRGPFSRVEQLDAVKGIGPKLLEKVRPLVTTEPARP